MHWIEAVIGANFNISSHTHTHTHTHIALRGNRAKFNTGFALFLITTTPNLIWSPVSLSWINVESKQRVWLIISLSPGANVYTINSGSCGNNIGVLLLLTILALVGILNVLPYIYIMYHNCILSNWNKFFLWVGVAMTVCWKILYCYSFLLGFKCIFQLYSSAFSIS